MIGRHTERGPWARALRWSAIAALSLGAAVAGAAEVSEVRVGTHEQHTRIVLELDSATGYRLEAPQPGARPELVLSLDATSVPRDVPSKSPLVRKVHVEPTSSGSVVRVQLATADVAVKEMLLANPPRLVFDLKARGPIPKDLEPIADESEPALAQPLQVAEAEPAPVSPPANAEAAPAPVEKIAAPTPAPEPVAEAEPVSEPIAVAAAEAQPEPKPPAPIAVTPPPAKPAAPSDAEARRKAAAAKAQQETQSASSWMALLMSPLGLGAIVGAVIVAALVVMRRRRASEDEDPLYTVMAADDAAAVAHADDADEAQRAERPPVLSVEGTWGEPEEISEPALREVEAPRQLHFGAAPQPDEPEAAVAVRADEPVAEPASVPVPFLRGGDASDSLFDEGPEPVAEIQTQPVVAAAPLAVSAAPVPAEMERRLAEFERRLEQLTEARERLERQVAAQTEELRVQRAAIARTQRVVRSIAKTEDLATEPVPRAPSAS
ncbi:MAG: hypothetical protein DCC71_19755 [Proteobacteria bacterium]|nr:MAG: hypothetical protein DCC71_19755 [Pseudomonadota bacterium]